jgi:hypothetical protein
MDMMKLIAAVRSFSNAPKKLKWNFWNARKIFPCGNESVIKEGWRKNTAGR